MGNKNSAKPEKKKPTKAKPKAAPRKREDFSQAAVRIVREATERD